MATDERRTAAAPRQTLSFMLLLLIFSRGILSAFRRRGHFCGEMTAHVFRIPGSADDAGVDPAHAHAELSTVAALHLASLRLHEPRGVDLHIGVQVSFGQG